ncbi:Sec7 domain-containing protein, partial [Phlyctochytrium arcticum]
RRFVHQGRAWQVMTTSTVKDRYLFLFTDILVIAKQLKSETETAKPLFQVKSIMPLRHAQLVLKDERWQYSYRTPSSAIQAAIRKFSTNPIKAIAYLIAKRAFPCTPEAIAHFLHITSGLSRKQLGRFMGINEHADILQSFLSMFPLKGQRLDECLRLFLSTVRLPGEASTIDFVLDSFAKRWYHYNKDTVDFDANVTLKLVFTIMELNAEIHNPYADETNATTSREFVDRFRTGVRAEAVAAGSGIYSSGVSNELLENMYDSVRREKLEMADLDSDAGEKERNEHALPPFPSRLTLKHTSPLIQVKISQPDPNFRIHMHGQDLVFDPPVLDFTRSNTATFTMRGTGLGRKLVFFTKRGAASSTRKYVTPQTRQVTIEPAFLRHSFQTTFHSH